MTDQPVCAIIGAGAGNGLALAQRFSAAGYRTALVARSRDALESLAERVNGAAAYAADVTDAEAINSALRLIAREHGPIDTLLYNAGFMVFGSAEDIRLDEFETAWRVNTLGLLHCARAVAPGMRAAGRGQIVVSGATASKKGGANFAGFAAAKAAQYSLAQSLARQLGPDGIHVAIAIIDGVIESKSTRAMLPDRNSEDFMQAEAIAESVYQITRQPRSAWTFELDLRPYREDW